MPDVIHDKYAEAVEHLTEYPDEIGDAWDQPYTHPAGCLFQFTGQRFSGYGCLTQVHSKAHNEANSQAPTRELTELIRADSRIPDRPQDITVASLPVFVEWNRRLDAELGEDRKGVAR